MSAVRKPAPMPPLCVSAWPLYVRLCSARNERANPHQFVHWLCELVRPLVQRHRCVSCDPMKREALALITAQVTEAEKVKRDAEIAEARRLMRCV